MKVAIVEKAPGKVYYDDYFDFEFDLFQLTQVPTKKKLLVKDITLDFDADAYDYVIVVGAEPCKHVAKISSVTKFQGYLVEDKFLPLTNPAALRINPAAKPSFDNSIKNIKSYISGETINPANVDVSGIQDAEEAKSYIRWLADNVDTIAVDTETFLLDPKRGYILGLSLSHEVKQGVYIDTECIDPELESLLRNLFLSKKCIFHNSKYDIKWLTEHFNFIFPDFEDTMLLHYCLNEQPGTHGLKELAIKYTDLGEYDRDLDIFKREYCSKNKVKVTEFTYDLIPFDIMYKYAALDTACTLELFLKFNKMVRSSPKLSSVYDKLLIEGTKFLIKIEDNGIPFSIDRLKAASIELDKTIGGLAKQLYDYKEVHTLEEIQGTIFKIGSPKQVSNLLFNICGLTPSGKKTTTGANSTDAESMEIIAKQHPLPKLLLEIKQLTKIKNTYIDKVLVGLDVDSRLRTGFNLTTTTSGRLSSSGKLNAQQFPRKNKVVKAAIKARDGWKIVSGDLSTAEMYIAAVLSNDKTLQEVFVGGVDYHGFMAVNKFSLPCHPNEVATLFPDDRQAAKTISFEILYKLNYNEPALKSFPRLKKWLQEQDDYIRTHGHVYQAFGRKRRLPNVNSSSISAGNHEVRSGVNSLVQGPSSDINLLAAIDMQEYIERTGMKALIWGLVHDSILAEVPDEEVEHYSMMLKKFMQKDRGLSIPGTPIGVDIEIGQDYSFPKAA